MKIRQALENNVNIRSVWCRTASEAPLLRKCLSGVGIVVESLSDFHLSFLILIFNKPGMLTAKPIFYFLTVVRHASHPIHQYFVFVSGTLPEAEMLLNLKEEPIPEDPLETGTVSKVESEPAEPGGSPSAYMTGTMQQVASAVSEIVGTVLFGAGMSLKPPWYGSTH